MTKSTQNEHSGARPDGRASSAQYLSEHGYAARAARRSDRPNLVEIIAELLRLRGGTYLQHFNNGNGRTPATPDFVEDFGMEVAKLMRWAQAFTEECERVMVHRKNGKRVKRKCDIPVLLCVVASYPVKALSQPSDLELEKMPLPEKRALHRKLVAANRELARSKEFIAWRDATIAWALQRYTAAGAVPVAACVHVDESNLHLHMTFHNHTSSVKPLMAGPAAALKVERSGGSKKSAQQALLAANRELGDDYHQAVSVHFGHERRSSAPKPSPTGRAYSKKRAKEIAKQLVAQAEEDSRLMKAAAMREAEAIRRTAEERARQSVEAAYELAEAEIGRRREAELERLRKEALSTVVPEHEKLKTAMVDVIKRYRSKEKQWMVLLEETIPDQHQRARLLQRVGR